MSAVAIWVVVCCVIFSPLCLVGCGALVGLRGIVYSCAPQRLKPAIFSITARLEAAPFQKEIDEIQFSSSS